MATAKHTLSNMKLSEVTLCRKGKVPGAVVTLFKAAKSKTENGKSFSAADYAYVGDAEDPSTWKLRIVEEPGAKPTAHQIGMAAAALSAGGFRGNKVELPSGAVAGVKTRLRAAWHTANPGKSDDEMPASIAKSAADPDDDGDTDTLDFTSALAREKLSDQVQGCCSEMWTAWNAFQDSVMSIATGTDPDGGVDTGKGKTFTAAQRKAALKDTIEQFSSWLEDQIPALAVTKVVSKGLSLGGAGADPSSTHEDMIMTMAELAQALEKAQGEITELAKASKEKDAEIARLNALKNKKAADAPDEDDDVTKGLPEGVRAIIEKSRKDAADAIAKANAIEEQRAVEISIAKAAPLVGVMPTNATKLGTLLHEVHKAAPAHAEELERLFKGAAAMMADHNLLFEALGNSGSEDTGADGSRTALNELNAATAELRKAEPALTEAAAFTKAMQLHPEIYARYQREARGI